MKKIIVATALILCLILAMAACKKDETNGDTPTETTVTTESQFGTEPGGKKPEETTAGDEKTKETLAGGMEIADKDEAKYGQAQYRDGK